MRTSIPQSSAGCSPISVIKRRAFSYETDGANVTASEPGHDPICWCFVRCTCRTCSVSTTYESNHYAENKQDPHMKHQSKQMESIIQKRMNISPQYLSICIMVKTPFRFFEGLYHIILTTTTVAHKPLALARADSL